MPRPESESETQVISVSTILILSGFIIGLTISNFVDQGIAPYLLAAGLSGFMAFLVLGLSGVRRNQEALKVEQAQIEDRLDKHTCSLTSIGFTLEPISSSDEESIEPESEPDAAPVSESDQVAVSA